LKNSTKQKLVLLGFGIFFIVAISLLIFDRINTIFNVTAQTEVISCYTDQKPSSRINLFAADIYTIEDEIAKSFEGSIELSDSVNIKMERISNGPLLIEIERVTGGVVAKLRSFNERKKTPILVHDLIFIEISKIDSLLDNNASIVIPITGHIKLGNSIDIESDNEYSLLLRAGDITMTGVTSLFNSHFVAGNEKLYLGDQLIFDDKNSIGIATINEQPAIQVSYRGIDKHARILKPGPKDFKSGYQISASIFSRFKYDNSFQIGSIIIALLISTITILDFYYNHIKKQKKNKR